MRSRLMALSAAALLVITSVAATSAQASAENALAETKTESIQPVEIDAPPPPGFSSWEEVLAAQGKLDAAAERLRTAGGADEGFGKVIESVEEHRVRLLWKGEVPAQVRSVVSELGDIVEVVPARYSAQELDRESKRLRRLATGTDGFQITEIHRSPQDGLWIGVTGSTADAAASSAVREAGVPVAVTAAKQAESLSRAADSLPFWGGAAVTVDPNDRQFCSTGFGMRDLSTSATFMLTAGHCGKNNRSVLIGAVWPGTNGNAMGTTAGNNVELDSMKIKTNAGAAIYNNNSTTEFSNPVIGSKYPFEGQFLCTSGAFSGTRCNAKVGEVDIEFGDRYPLAQLDSLTSNILAGEGDSGGPVFQVNPQNTRQVYAVGLISMANPWAPGFLCNLVGGGNLSTPPLPGSHCFRSIWFPYIQEMEDAYNAAVLTSNAP
nr:hypothetical protein GCM10020063_090060 [Dactylosporangium thailandense]